MVGPPGLAPHLPLPWALLVIVIACLWQFVERRRGR